MKKKKRFTDFNFENCFGDCAQLIAHALDLNSNFSLKATVRADILPTTQFTVFSE